MESVEEWWERVKDQPYHPDEHLMPFIDWIRGARGFMIHLNGRGRKKT